MTRIIFLGGNPNRQQDILKSCRKGPGASEHANIVQKHILCDQISEWKSSCENIELLTRIMFLDGNPNRRPDLFKSCGRGPGPSNNRNIMQKHISCDEICIARKLNI